MKTRSATSNARRTLLRKGRDLLRSVSGGRAKHKTSDVMDLLNQDEKKLLSTIHLALEKIERGIFGACEDCSERISEEQLEHEPWQASCTSCLQAQSEPSHHSADDAQKSATELSQ